MLQKNDLLVVDNDSTVSAGSSGELSRENAATTTGKRRGILKVRTEQEALARNWGDHVKRKQNEEQQAGEDSKSPVGPKILFSEITIREYPITMGDNPSPFCGPPLSIDWRHQWEDTISLDDYENLRLGRRTGREMIMPCSMREELLLKAGFARKEIVQLTKPVNITRAQRRHTVASMGMAPLQEVTETFVRKTKCLFNLVRRKKNEKKLLLETYKSKSLPIAPPVVEPPRESALARTKSCR